MNKNNETLSETIWKMTGHIVLDFVLSIFFLIAGVLFVQFTYSVITTAPAWGVAFFTFTICALLSLFMAYVFKE